MFVPHQLLQSDSSRVSIKVRGSKSANITSFLRKGGCPLTAPFRVYFMSVSLVLFSQLLVARLSKLGFCDIILMDCREFYLVYFLPKTAPLLLKVDNRVIFNEIRVSIKPESCLPKTYLRNNALPWSPTT